MTAVLRSVDSLRTPDEWADIIKEDLGRSIEGIIAAGQHLIEAKAELDHHGKWIPMVENQLGLSIKTANHWMKLAQHPVIQNYSPASNLPTQWTILEPLARLEPAVLEAEIAAGTVTSDMSRKDARELLRKYKPPREPKARPDDRSGATLYSKGIQRISASIADNCDNLSNDQIVEALGAAKFLYELLRGEKIIRERNQK